MRNGFLLLLVLVAGCGGDDDDGGGGDPDASTAAFLGPAAARYTEANEVPNGTRATAEMTAYTLTADGIALSGTFEATAPTPDIYRFNTGTFGGATQPDFPGLDTLTIVGSLELGQGAAGVSSTLDAFANDGFSTLSGNKFINAAVTRGVDYVITITPSAAAAGKSYTIQLKGHVP